MHIQSVFSLFLCVYVCANSNPCLLHFRTSLILPHACQTTMMSEMLYITVLAPVVVHLRASLEKFVLLIISLSINVCQNLALFFLIHVQISSRAFTKPPDSSLNSFTSSESQQWIDTGDDIPQGKFFSGHYLQVSSPCKQLHVESQVKLRIQK